MIFPEATCEPYGVEPQHPDEFVEHLVELDPAAISQFLIRWLDAEGIRRPRRRTFDFSAIEEIADHCDG
ncbi:MAG: hypothetical protein GEU71_19065 [Actinobacteria bacterium]|nr:hypothetical protein [Actinomycetota bacterium]